MSAKHQSAEWRRTVRLIRGQVNKAWREGREVYCWRCGGEIPPQVFYDVGHIDPLGGQHPGNAAPEHRGENRRAGGRTGARITNARKSKSSTFQALPWAN